MTMVRVQLGYLQARLRAVRKPPWSLAVGDVAANLVALREGLLPAEPTTRKIYQLLRMEYPQAVVQEGIALLAECPWTSKLVEQPHASMKSLMSAHASYGIDIMMARAMIMQCRPLFAVDPDERKLANLCRRIDALRHRQPQRITGRHMFVRALTVLASSENDMVSIQHTCTRSRF
jgi:hypothetical protein